MLINKKGEIKMKVTYEEILGGIFAHEIDIEVNDKINLIEDGMKYEDVMNECIDDFDILRKILFNNLNIEKRKLHVTAIRRLMDFVDESIDEAIDYIIKKLKERRMKKGEDRFNQDFRRNVEGKLFDRRND